MSDPRSSSDQAESLRQRAEAVVRQEGSPGPASPATPPADTATPPPHEAELHRPASPELVKRVAAKPLHELRVHQIELEMQNEELRRTQVELDAAKARYFDLYDLAPVGYVTVSDKGLILESNLTAATLLGVKRSGLAGWPLSQFILRDDADTYYLLHQRLAATGTAQTCELRMEKADGTRFWAELTTTPAPDFEGTPACRVVLIDITARKRAEAAMAASEEKFRAIADYTVDWESWFAPDGKYVWVSPSVTRYTGYSPAEILLMPDFASTLVAEEDQAKFRLSFREALRGIPGDNFEFRCVRKDGSQFWLSASWQAIFDANGHSIGVRASGRDITERQQAEAAVKASEEKYRLLFASAGAAIFIHDEAGRMLAVNPVACERLGYTEGELMALTPQQVDSPAESPHIAKRLAQVIDSGQIKFETVHQHKDGSPVPTEVVARRITWEGRPAVMSICRDITARKQAEATRNFLARTCSGTAAEPFFRLLARYLAQDLGMDFVCVDRLEGDGLNARTVAVWCDGKFEDNVTYALKDTPCGDVVGKTVCCFPASVCQFFPRDQVLQDLRAESYIGTTLWSHNGQPIGLIAVISRRPLAHRAHAEATLQLVAERAAGELERQQAEESLRLSAERHTAILQTAMSGFWMANTQGRLLEVNDAYCRMSGYSVPELLSMGIADLEAKETASDMIVHMEEIKALGQARFEAQHRRKDGSIFDVEASVQYRPADGGRVVAFIRDITARKRSEAELREALAKYQTLFEHFPVGVTIADEAGHIVECNSTAVTLLGLPRAEHIQRDIDGAAWHVVHPDGTPMPPEEFASVRALKEKRVVSDVEIGIVKPDSSTTWLSVTAAPLPVEGLGVVITYGDITARKEAEAALQEKLVELERMNRLMVGRENRMIELKREINDLSQQLNLSKRYSAPDATAPESKP